MKKAPQTKATRAAYRALVAAHVAGKALSEIGSNGPARAAVSATREEARLELELGGHYPNKLIPDFSAHSTADEIENGGEIDGWTDERATVEARSFCGNLTATFEFLNHYNSRTGQYYTEFSSSALKDKATWTVVEYKAARSIAFWTNERHAERRSESEYSRSSVYVFRDYVREEVTEEPHGGYTVTVIDDLSDNEMLTVYFAEDGRAIEAQDANGDVVKPTEDEIEATREAVVEYLQEKLDLFTNHC